MCNEKNNISGERFEYKQIKNDKPDIIHTIGLRSFQSIIAWFVSKKTNIPLIVSDQGGLTTHPFLHQSGLFSKILYNIQNFFVKRIIEHSYAISVANEYEKEMHNYKWIIVLFQ